MKKEGSGLAYHLIGELIRKYRKDKGLKLIDLASKTGMGSALLSKIENGRMIPTIPTLFSIVSQLNIPLDQFFGELNQANEFPGYIFIPQSAYKPYVKEEKAQGYFYSSILEHGMTAGSFQISLLELLPGAKRKQVSTEAHEYIYVLDGPLEYHLEKEVFKMNTGDSLFFDGKIPHHPINTSRKKVLMLVVYFFT